MLLWIWVFCHTAETYMRTCAIIYWRSYFGVISWLENGWSNRQFTCLLYQKQQNKSIVANFSTSTTLSTVHYNKTTMAVTIHICSYLILIFNIMLHHICGFYLYRSSFGLLTFTTTFHIFHVDTLCFMMNKAYYWLLLLLVLIE